MISDYIKIFIYLSVLIPFYLILEMVYGFEIAILGVAGIIALFVGLTLLFMKKDEEVEQVEQ